MVKIKLNLRDLPIPEKITRARQIVASLQDNRDFPSTQPTLAQVTTAIDEFDTAYAESQAARQDARAKTSAQNQKEEALDRIMSRLASFIESASGGDETKIKNAGMDTKSTRSSTSAGLAAPAALAASAGDHEGEIDLHWDKVDKARSYVIEKSADPPTAISWQHCAVSLKSRAIVEGLTSGTKYWFRVAAVGTNGQSGWSDPATKLAP
jgi:hypothetical protein